MPQDPKVQGQAPSEDFRETTQDDVRDRLANALNRPISGAGVTDGSPDASRTFTVLYGITPQKGRSSITRYPSRSGSTSSLSSERSLPPMLTMAMHGIWAFK
jgi:hypothetical protein